MKVWKQGRRWPPLRAEGRGVRFGWAQVGLAEAAGRTVDLAAL